MSNHEQSRACCIPDSQDSYTEDPDRRNNVRPQIVSQSAAPPAIDSVSLGGDWFDMGCAESPHPEDGEGPVRSVWIDPFLLARTVVSNQQFQHFVDITSYQTDAERAGSSFVFHMRLDDAQSVPASALAPWWRDVATACWHTPEGPGSSIEHRLDHPVVHITQDDALQYCRWSGTRLPTEAEWEYAARGGLSSQPYPWGAELQPDGEERCNIWQGDFPNTHTGSNGFRGTAPVREYTANAYGLFNMTGNVWEWVADRFTNMHSPRATKNPKGPLNGERYVAKGGSYLCHESYCFRYRNSSRQALPRNVSSGNLGFRVVSNSADQAWMLSDDAERKAGDGEIFP